MMYAKRKNSRLDRRQTDFGGTMISKTNLSFARAALQGLAVLALLIGATAAVSPSQALVTTPPPNDAFANAIKISGTLYSQSHSDINLASSDAATDPVLTCNGGGIGEESVWYTFTPPSGGQLNVNTTNSAYDTIITIFKDDLPSNPKTTLIELGCNDNANVSTATSALSIPLRGGTKYYIEVVRKTGGASSPPDALKFTFQWAARVIADEGLYDSTSQAPPFYYTPVGWTMFPVLPGITHNNNVSVGNNPGDAAAVYFDGDRVELCYVAGPDMGSLKVYLDDKLAGTINQGNSTYVYACQTLVYTKPPYPYYVDNVHKVTMRHGGPSGKKVNIDTVKVTAYNDVTSPHVITDLGPKAGTPPAGKLILQWKAPGDDGYYGRVARYEVRYVTDAVWVANGSPNPWNQATWDAGSPILGGLPSPLVGGSIQYMTISGLAPGVEYHFNVIGFDEAGNPVAGTGYSNDYHNHVSTWASGTNKPGMYDDRSTAWKWAGSWNNVASPDNYKDTLRVATKVDSAAQITFTGSQFRLYYNGGYDQGLMDVYLDGYYLTTIDQYTPLPHRLIYVSPMMMNGPHTVRLIMTTLRYINIDAIGVFAITDGGPPDPITNLVATSSVTTDGAVNLTWTATGDDPGGVGTAASYEVRYSTSPILTDLDWLAASIAPGLVPVPSVAGSAEAMTVTGLVPGVDYWFAIRATDDAAYSVLSNTDHDPAGVVPFAYAGPGAYQDTAPFPTWRYYGAWSIVSNVSASGGKYHSTNVGGSSAVFLFNGTGFTLTFTKGSSFGKLKVYVDGVLRGQIDQQNGSTLWKRTWTLSGLALGHHTVQFVATSKANIDAIKILP